MFYMILVKTEDTLAKKEVPLRWNLWRRYYSWHWYAISVLITLKISAHTIHYLVDRLQMAEPFTNASWGVRLVAKLIQERAAGAHVVVSNEDQNLISDETVQELYLCFVYSTMKTSYGTLQFFCR